ncbi:MAG: type IV secretion protein Rhs, partial [Cutibacterium acnes]
MLSHWIGNAESEMVFQQITHGHVDYGEAVLSGVLEPIAGPISGKIAGPGTQTLLS